MAVVAEILRQRLDDVAVAPIRDPAAVAQMIAAGSGKSAFARRTYRHARDRPPRQSRSEVSGKVGAITDGEFTITGPMYTGIRVFGRTAVLEIDNAGAKRNRCHRARARADGSGRVHTIAASTPPQALHHAQVGSIHYRAGFKPIAAHIVRMRRRRSHQRRPVGVSLPETHAADLSARPDLTTEQDKRPR
jgi:microcystin degradation protein MlrC